MPRLKSNVVVKNRVMDCTVGGVDILGLVEVYVFKGIRHYCLAGDRPSCSLSQHQIQLDGIFNLVPWDKLINSITVKS